jgi:hypothetical protein
MSYQMMNPLQTYFVLAPLQTKITGVVYNNLTGNFRLMLLNGSICFFVMYHYKTNSILATLIANLDDKSIFVAYKTDFEWLEWKGFKLKLNVMDNQATK